MSACPVKICEVGGSGYTFPFPHENEWKKEPRAFLYLALLFWCFMGVAIVADVFMAAIEKVTSKKRTIKSKDGKSVRTVKVWNDTVANLTLMALGSSAPEILLNVIEICLGGFELGPLGASTIVGSAAFNLLIISAVCVIAIDGGDIRYIKDTNVYAITAFFSVFAYVWLLLIVVVISPEIVDVWEAVVTFLMFPLLTVLSYGADIGVFGKGEARQELSAMNNDEMAQAQVKILQRYGTMSDEKLFEIMQREYGEKVSRAAYRVQATIGAKMVKTEQAPKTSQVVPFDDSEHKEKMKVTTIQFASCAYTVMESIGEMEIEVVRTGEMESGTVKVGYKTIDGTAQGGKDFEVAEGTLEFGPNCERQIIKIPIINDTDLEKDEYFTIELSNPQGDDGCKVKAELGENTKTEVRIIDDDDPGQICFKDSLVQVSEDTRIKTLSIHVERRNGSRGEIGCSYKTEDDSAKAGADYEEASGTLTLKDGQAEAFIEIQILPRGRYENEETFRVVIEEPTGGATLVESDERDMSQCTVTIQSDGKVKDSVDRIVSMAAMNWDKTAIGNRNWKQQFIDALSVKGGGDEEEEEEESGPPTKMDYVMHGISVFWKVLFACIPPPDYCDGWLCFCIALLAIGGVTCVISDLANLVGCCLGMPAEITAITFVALGTSLPDTFASKAAAVGDPYADASVGNVTGSNSVNVFLGLGLPWTIAAVYWAADGKKFNVPSGNLGPNVATFVGCALVAIGLLTFRRKACGGELGGPSGLKWASFTILCSLWLVYIVVSSIVVLSKNDPCA